jgi:hypothetical protein
MTQRLVMAKALVCCLACCMMCDLAMQGMLENVRVPRILKVILGYHVPFCFMQGTSLPGNDFGVAFAKKTCFQKMQLSH